MKRVLPLAMLVTALTTGCWTTPGLAREFLEVEARVEDGPESGSAVAIVQQIILLQHETAGHPKTALWVRCPVETKLWQTEIRKGQSIPLVWDVQGGRAALQVLGAGWTRDCRCEGKPVKKQQMFGRFVDANGHSMGSSIQVRGAGKLKRVLTLGIAHGPRLPKQVRIRLSWTPVSDAPEEPPR